MSEQERQDLEATKPKEERLIVHDDSEFATLMDSARFAQAWRVATLFAKSEMVPEHFQKKPESVMVILQMAFRLKVDPLMLLQNTYIVHGRPGMESKMKIALVNQRGPFTGPIQYRFEGEGDKRQCTAYATHKATGEVCEFTVTWAMVKAEGWSSKSNSKWNTLPELMFRYRSASYLINTACPEVTMGLPTMDELADMGFDLRQSIPGKRHRRLAAPITPAEVNQDAVSEFDRLAVELGIDNSPQFLEFLEAIAKDNESTVELIKSEAAPRWHEFLAAFKEWNEVQMKPPKEDKPKLDRKPRSDKGTRRASEPPQGAPKEEAPGHSTGGEAQPPQSPPQAATPEILASIRTGIAYLGLSEANLCMEWEISNLKELDQKAGENMLAYLREEAKKRNE